MQHGTREELFGHLARAVRSVSVAHPTRVAIDGPPASGKTTLADELAVLLRKSGRVVVRATVDDFLFPKARRYRRGEYSAAGCYYDAHDTETLKRVLLDPLGPDGDRRFRSKVYDHSSDAALSSPVTTAAADAVLLFDGVFLMRPELVDRWELRILISSQIETAISRAVVRERLRLPAAGVERRWRERYIPAQRLYLATARPDRVADILVDNDDPPRPGWETLDAERSRCASHCASLIRGCSRADPPGHHDPAPSF